jgi:ketosteroid isomerase-like protein
MMSREQEEIAKLDAKWATLATAALKQGATDRDFKAVTDLYSQEGTIVWPGFPPGYGHEEIEKGWRTANARFSGAALQFNAVRITIMGELATDFGEVVFNGEGGSKYFVVWRREHGEWKVFSDAWNENTPSSG